MKKLVVLATCAIVALIGQAANVTWNVGSIKAPGADGTFGSGNAQDAGYDVSVAVSFFLDNSGAVGDAITGFSGGTTSTTWANGGAVKGTTAGYDFTNGSSYWTSAKILLTKGSEQWELDIEPFKFTNTKATGNYSIATALQNEVTTVGKFTAVPEPTSALLFALGFAMVGLKRKRA